MTPEEVMKLKPGAYWVWWNDGADYPPSLASVGVAQDGSRWMACCNHTSVVQHLPRGDGSFHSVASAVAAVGPERWEMVDRVELAVAVGSGPVVSAGEQLRKLVREGLAEDGEHHKQWYLEQVARLVLSPYELEEIEGDHEMGVSP